MVDKLTLNRWPYRRLATQTMSWSSRKVSAWRNRELMTEVTSLLGIMECGSRLPAHTHS